VLSRMKKRVTREQISDALRLSHRLGFKTKVFFTFGHIGETMADARETLRFIRQNSRYITRLGGGVGINVFPGTEVEEYARESGALDPEFSWSTRYYEPRNPFFATPPNVPLLIQPQFGWKEMKRVRYLQLLHKAQDPKLVLSYLRHLGDPGTLRRVGRLLAGPFRRARRATAIAAPEPDEPMESSMPTPGTSKGGRA